MRGLLLALVLVAACSEAYEGRDGRVFEGHVTRVIGETEQVVPGGPRQVVQRVEVELDGSLYRGDRVEVAWGGGTPTARTGLLRVGDRLLLSAQRADDGARHYVIHELVRLPSLAPLAVAAALQLQVVARLNGLASVAGLAGSVAVFLVAVVPALRRGDDPLTATLLGAALVLLVAVYLVHGLSRKSTAALLGTCVGLVTVAGVGVLGVEVARVNGVGNEELASLAAATTVGPDMPRLVLAGIVVASLGALVDLCIGQSSITFQLASVDPGLRGGALYGSALNAGREHIGSLVNTLALASFGSALPLVLLLSVGNAPLVVLLNGETIVTALVGALAAAAGLALSVPATTALAVAFVPRR